MNSSKKAAGYVRCSTEEQHDSPEQQKKEILVFAAQRGYNIIEWYEDFGKSGTTFSQRPAFQKMLSVVEKGAPYEAVICYDESRWGRAIRSVENGYWTYHFEKHGVRRLLVKTSVDATSEYAPMFEAFEGVQASQLSKKLSELTIRGARNNGPYSNGGTAPYGYKRSAVNIATGVRRDLADGEWAVRRQEKVIFLPGVSSEIEIVKLIFRDRARGFSYSAIVKNLNDAGVSCPKRGRWKNKDQKWSTVTVKTILENPVYLGSRVYNRNSMSKIRAEREGWDRRDASTYPHWTQERSEWVITENAHEAIVDQDIWKRVNKKRATVSHTKPKQSAPYLLSGLMKCTQCGFHFQGQTTGAKGRQYPRYICGGYNAKRVCSYCVVKRDSIESFVLACIQETLSSNHILSRVQDRLKVLLQRQSEAAIDSGELLSEQERVIKRKKHNITSAIEEGAPPEWFRERIGELAKEEADLIERKELTRSIKRESKDRQDLGLLVQRFSDDFRDRFGKAPLGERKILIRKCVEGIDVTREERLVRCYIRQLPYCHNRIEEAYESRRKQKLATKRPPVVNAVVAGAGLEPATFGL